MRLLLTRTAGVVALVLTITVCFGVAQADAAAFEPNDTINQAYGPLVGASPLTAAIDTSNDVDFYYFYTSGQVQFQLEVQDIAEYGCVRVSLLRGDDGNSIYEAQVYGNELSPFNYSAPGPRRYFLKFESCLGYQSPYIVTLSPVTALTTTPPPPALAPDCIVANARVDVASVRVAKAVRKYRRTHGRTNKRRQARKVRIARGKLRAAIQTANSACAAPADY